MAFEELACNIVELDLLLPADHNQNDYCRALKTAHYELEKLLRPIVDYGIICVAELKNEIYKLKGFIILGSR